MPDQTPDKDIIERIAGGDVNAFETLVSRYRSFVFAIVSKHLPAGSVEETAHDAFVRAYQSLPGYNGNGPFKYWLAKIAVRCCYDYWRDFHRRKELLLGSLGEEHEQWLDSVLAAESREAFEREASSREAAELLRLAMAGLSAEDRMVITMVHLEGLSVKETARLLGWSVVGVKVRAHRSRKQLRKIIVELLEKRQERS